MCPHRSEQGSCNWHWALLDACSSKICAWRVCNTPPERPCVIGATPPVVQQRADECDGEEFCAWVGYVSAQKVAAPSADSLAAPDAGSSSRAHLHAGHAARTRRGRREWAWGVGCGARAAGAGWRALDVADGAAEGEEGVLAQQLRHRTEPHLRRLRERM